jgi:CubicO group peptidase (beta-lactamase class C family)
MRQTIKACLCAAGLLAVACPTVTGQTWDAEIESVMSAGGIPGLAALVIRDGQTVLSRGYGVLRVGGTDRVTPETLFQVGSLTKAVTAMAIAALVGDGRLQWDDPIQKHLSGFQLADPWTSGHITIRDALAMRSGIVSGDTIALFRPITRAQIIEAAAHLEAPRFRETYGLSPNLMYFLAGEVVAAVSGVSWDDFVRQRFFEPLKMTRTFSAYDAAEAQANYAWPHLRRGAETVPRDSRARADNVAAAGGVVSSISDWAQWVRLNLDGGLWEGRALVAAEPLAETRQPQILLTPAYQGYFNPDALLNAYGFGWVISEYRGHLLIEHGGTLPGNASIIALVPDQRIGIVLMSNLAFASAMPSLLRLKFQILDDLLERRLTDDPPQVGTHLTRRFAPCRISPAR